MVPACVLAAVDKFAQWKITSVFLSGCKSKKVSVGVWVCGEKEGEARRGTKKKDLLCIVLFLESFDQFLIFL